MRRAQRRSVFFDKGLENAVDVRANSLAISRPVVLDCECRFETSLVAVIIARLWFLRAPLSLIIGVYLIITGLGRLVEKSYRGEPQTAIYWGLRLYQWMAILSVVSGVLAPMVGDTPRTPLLELNWASVIAAGCFGVLTSYPPGLDFPESNKRFARLA